MYGPPIHKQTIVIYGQDGLLLHTRQLILQKTQYVIHTVQTLSQLENFIERKVNQVVLIVLCHTVPAGERETIRSIAVNFNLGLYQLEMMEQPARFSDTVSEMMAQS